MNGVTAMTGKITINDILDNDSSSVYKNEYEINMEHLSDEYIDENDSVVGEMWVIRLILIVMIITMILAAM